MSNEFVYARQVPPEQQESMIDDDMDECYVKVVFSGNRHFNSHHIDLLKKIEALGNDICPDDYQTLDLMDWCKEEFTKQGDWGYKAKTLEEFLNAHYTTEQHPAWTAEEAGRFLEAFTNEISAMNGYRLGQNSPEDWRAEQLSILMGEKYETATINGNCQGDWQTIYYPANGFDAEAIEYLETAYFNTGTEWIIHDEAEAPETPEDISGYSMYCYTRDPRKEIAENAGVSPDKVCLYTSESYTAVRYIASPDNPTLNNKVKAAIERD